RTSEGINGSIWLLNEATNYIDNTGGEDGGITAATGELVSDNRRLRSTNFINLSESIYGFWWDLTGWDEENKNPYGQIFEYDSNDNYLGRTDWVESSFVFLKKNN